MAFNLESISKGKIIKAPRIIILGVKKIGKTSFACGSKFVDGKIVEHTNSPIGISIKGETGMDDMDVPKFPTCKTYADLMQCLSTLYTEDVPFRTVVIDSASALALLINDEVCAEFSVSNVRKVPGFRVGDAAIQQRWRGIMDGLDSLREEKNMSIIIIGHIKVKKHKNPEGDDWDCYDFDLESDVSELLGRWSDLILFANTKVVVKKEGEDNKFIKAKRRGVEVDGGQRFMYTQPRPSHPGGGRGIYGQLPYELPLEWDAFQAAVAELV